MPIDNAAYHSSGPGAPQRPGARERGRMRRRLRQQRRMREALLLDLGALVFELHRQGRRAPELLQAKAAELGAVDQECRALARALDYDQSVAELVSAGIAGSCGSCGSLLSTDARYCPACGVPALGGDRRRADPALGRQPARAPLDAAAARGGPANLGGPSDEPAGRIERIRGLLGRRGDGG